MARMIAQVKTYKTYIYCNYADVTDSSVCSGVPCASTATSDHCLPAEPTASPAPSPVCTPVTEDCSGQEYCEVSACIDANCAGGGLFGCFFNLLCCIF